MLGHAHSIHSVALDETEELVAAGSSSGIIKLWDIQHNKGINNFFVTS